MKLYATVISDKASKSQGGNQYLYLRVQGAPPATGVLLDIELVPDGYGHAHVAKVMGSISLLRGIISVANEYIEQALKEQAKGEKQKGEVCEVPDCKGESSAYTGMRYGETHYWCDEHR